MDKRVFVVIVIRIMCFSFYQFLTKENVEPNVQESVLDTTIVQDVTPTKAKSLYDEFVRTCS